MVFYTSMESLPSTPSARPPITVPGSSHVSPSPTVVSGPAKVSYQMARYHDCSGFVRSGNDVEANLQNGRLSSYDCINDVELTSVVPTRSKERRDRRRIVLPLRK